MDLVSQNYWDHSYKDFVYHTANDEVTRWIDTQTGHLPHPGSLFEFGCYPGRYLSFMGKKGWRVNGIDLTPGIEKKFIDWLHNQRIGTGLLKQGDALAYAASTEDRYDMTCSFGFIEHFEDFLGLIVLHDTILKKGGWLMITTPNFRGSVQHFLHHQLNAEVLKIHYLPSMRPEVWKAKLEELGYHVRYSGYFGRFDFWVDETKRNLLQKVAIKCIRRLKPALKLLPNSAAYSPYCGILAQKIK